MDSVSKKRKEENGAAASAAGGDIPPSKLTLEEAGRIIDSLSPDQIRQILTNGMCSGADVLTSVREIADRDVTQRKLFIRGLGWETTSDSLTSYFSQYGDLQEAVVIVDRGTGRSKGYGFIVFSHVDGAVLALREPSKKIDGRMSVSQLAAIGAPNAAAPPHSAAEAGQRKIYVGNVPADMLPDRLFDHFSTYGEIEEGPLGFDKVTGKSKGYTMFVYKTEEGARAALVDPMKTIDGVHLLCKFADNKRGKVGGIDTSASGLQSIGMPGGNLSNAPGEGQQSSLPVGPFSSHYAAPYAAPGGISVYGGYPASGAYAGAGVPVATVAGLSHQQQLTSSLPSVAAGAGGASQVPSSVTGAPVPGGYGGTSWGGSSYVPSTQYAGSGSGSSGYAGLGLGSTLYRTGAMTGGSYAESGGHYAGLSSSAYQSQHYRPASPPTAPRVPSGGATYPSMPPYY